LDLTVCRFEEEILTSQKIGDDVPGNNSADSKVIIGSNTFDQVQAQLDSHRASSQAAPVTTDTQKPDNATTKPRLAFSGVLIHTYVSVVSLPFVLATLTASVIAVHVAWNFVVVSSVLRILGSDPILFCSVVWRPFYRHTVLSPCRSFVAQCTAPTALWGVNVVASR